MHAPIFQRSFFGLIFPSLIPTVWSTGEPASGLWIAISPPLPATAELLITLIGVIPQLRRPARRPPPPQSAAPTADTNLRSYVAADFFPDGGLFLHGPHF